MTTGIIALAVPGSAAFAGEFAILAGVFQTGWGWAVVGAIAIVLAAMYMLRLISAVLHEAPGPSVSLAALDLRPAELGVLVPLLACLLFLSAWPAAITDRSFVTLQQLTTASVKQGAGSTSITIYWSDRDHRLVVP
jgi:NADH-quinone oxidoreductase subunit M